MKIPQAKIENFLSHTKEHPVGHRKVSPESMAALHGAKLRSGRI